MSTYKFLFRIMKTKIRLTIIVFVVLLTFAYTIFDPVSSAVDLFESNFNVFDIGTSEPFFTPRQVHISFGENESSIVVTWSTENFTDSLVHYGIGDLKLLGNGSSKKFVTPPDNVFQFIHQVTLPDLRPNSYYKYRCGSDKGWSKVFTFKTVPKGPDWSPRFAVFGDFGLENARSLPLLTRNVAEQRLDMIIHNGDFAYDLDSDSGRVGDEFMEMIEPVAAHVPYMVAAGNHEEKVGFEQYMARFSMPRTEDNLYYSFDLGPAHFIAFSTDLYFISDVNSYYFDCLLQFDWLKNDLKEASKPENRAIRPWIITFAHSPMYCSIENYFEDCAQEFSNIRKTGYPGGESCPGLEDLFYEHGVDLELWAHEHVYERLWPVYDMVVYNGSFKHPYKNPRAPVHIISGSAGSINHSDRFQKKPAVWSAFRSLEYGYTYVQITNSSHLHIEQLSADQDGKVIDDIWLIKDTHGPYHSSFYLSDMNGSTTTTKTNPIYICPVILIALTVKYFSVL